VQSWLPDATGLPSLFDMAVHTPLELEALAAGAAEELMNSAEVRAELGVWGDAPPWVLNSPAVEEAHDDEMKSAKPDVETLLWGPARMCLLLYEGVLDTWDGMMSTEVWLREMHWDGLTTFQDAPAPCGGGEAAPDGSRSSLGTCRSMALSWTWCRRRRR
jgi:hypothetical protein